MEKDFEDKVAYVLGLVSIIVSLSLISPLGGLVSGIFGMVLSKNSKTDLGKRARRLNKWGIFIGAILFAVLISLTVWATINGVNNPVSGFPQY
ncbi:MAG: hypothetical protein Q7S56_00865 [Nanoarchaeota archaeon]|nr:hypothetical protein [Nanoarchaeota archaeon]